MWNLPRGIGDHLLLYWFFSFLPASIQFTLCSLGAERGTHTNSGISAELWRGRSQFGLSGQVGNSQRYFLVWPWIAREFSVSSCYYWALSETSTRGAQEEGALWLCWIQHSRMQSCSLLKTGQEVLCMLEEMLRTLQDQACEQQMHHRNSSSEELEWGNWCKSTSPMRGCVLFICQKMWILRGRTQNNEALLLSSIILLYFTELYPDCLFGFVCVGSHFPMLAFKFHLEDIWAPSLNLNIQMLLLSHFILPVDKCNLFTCSRSACMLIKHAKRNPM